MKLDIWKEAHPILQKMYESKSSGTSPEVVLSGLVCYRACIIRVLSACPLLRGLTSFGMSFIRGFTVVINWNIRMGLQDSQETNTSYFPLAWREVY